MWSRPGCHPRPYSPQTRVFMFHRSSCIMHRSAIVRHPFAMIIHRHDTNSHARQAHVARALAEASWPAPPRTRAGWRAPKQRDRARQRRSSTRRAAHSAQAQRSARHGSAPSPRTHAAASKAAGMPCRHRHAHHRGASPDGMVPKRAMHHGGGRARSTCGPANRPRPPRTRAGWRTPD